MLLVEYNMKGTEYAVGEGCRPAQSHVQAISVCQGEHHAVEIAI